VKFRTSFMLETDPVDLNSIECVPLWASLVHKAYHLDVHTRMNKRFCGPTRTWITGKCRKRYNSHPLSLQTGNSRTLKFLTIFRMINNWIAQQDILLLLTRHCSFLSH